MEDLQTKIDEVHFIRNAWNTCLEMITDRGFNVDNNFYEVSDADFKYMISEKKIDIYSKNPDNKAIYIKFFLNNKIKPSSIKAVIDEIKQECEHSKLDLVIVLKQKPNNTFLKIEKDKSFNNIQLMYLKQLQFNITKHSLVPTHTKCSEEEVNDVMKRFGITSKTQLPVILRDDPVARYYNYKSGDVIRITNTNRPMNSNYIFYRHVK
jgi:DNA-directed RNA polymerase subunit H (RpoH/RPB5)